MPYAFQCHKRPHFGRDAYQILVDFPNGFGLSVVHHRGAYCTLGANSFEYALLQDGQLVYTPEVPDVVGWQTAEEVMAFAKEVESWNPALMHTYDYTYPED
jgi:hypothetical protein